MHNRKKTIACLLILLLAAACIVFSPILHNGFTNWDDQAYITNNPDLKNFSLPGIVHVCTSFYNANYHPLTMVAYMLEYHFFKLAPSGYHAVSLLLHLVNCGLVLWLFLLLDGDLLTASCVALLFALHPLQVEPVAWVSSQKDLLFGMFFLATLIAYRYHIKKQKTVYYYIAICAFALSLLSKVTAIMLPFALLLIDYQQKRVMRKVMFFEKAIFFELAGIFLIVGMVVQNAYGTAIHSPLLSAIPRVVLVCHGIVFYLWKISFPAGLVCQYPFPRIAEITGSVAYLAAPFAVAALAILAAWSRRYTRKIIFGLLFFLALLLPVSQLVPCTGAFAADRYMYLAALGLYYIAAQGLAWIYRRAPVPVPIKRAVLGVLGAALVAVLCVVSWQRCAVWKNSVSLWSDCIHTYPDSPIARVNRAAAYLEQGQPALALEDCDRAILLVPEYAPAYLIRAYVYRQKGELARAEQDFKKYLGQFGPVK